jgi:hypothetical protein
MMSGITSGEAAVTTRAQPVNPCERVVYLLALLYFSCLENRHLWSMLTRCSGARSLILIVEYAVIEARQERVGYLPHPVF